MALWRIRFVKMLCRTGILLCLAFGCQSQGEVREFVLLHTNDSHGSIVAVDSLGGMAERATCVRMVREKNSAVLLLDAGDLNAGQVVSNLFDARPDIEAYNYMKYDAMVFGNHEFDKPLDVLRKQMEWANFPMFASNVEYQGKPLGKAYVMKEVNGVKVGIFGLTTGRTMEISMNGKEVVCKDEVETAREMLQELKNQRAEVIVGLVHLGFTEATSDYMTSLKLAELVDGVDVLVDGHSHSYIAEPVKIRNTWIVTASQSGRFVGEAKLAVKDGRLLEFNWKPVQIKGFPQDTVLRNILEPYIQGAAEESETVIGEAEDDFVLFVDDENMGRRQETTLGNMITDAMAWKVRQLRKKTDFALINSGAIREELPKGKITQGKVYSILPFGNELEIVALQGKEVKRLFDFIATIPLGFGSFPQVSKEVKVVYSEQDKQVRALTLDGQPIDDDRTYYMVTCDYVASGMDGYDAGLENCVSREKTSLLLADIVTEYIRVQRSVVPRLEGRIKIQ